MKRFLMAIMLLISYAISAQLTIEPGAQFSVTGNLKLMLHNTDLINNGSFTTGNSVISFGGNVSTSISGSQSTQFSELTVNKINNSSLILRRAINVTQRVLFASGFLDLNGFNTDLGSTARLENEREDSHIIGANGGQVIASAVLNAPNSENPGNLGAIISSPQNMGSVIVKRGHQSQNVISAGKSILRYYDLFPENNTSLNAVLQVNYLDAELNGVNENSLVFFKSDDGVTWSEQGVTLRNVVTNSIDKNQIGSFSRWTLSAGTAPFPAQFVLFNSRCDGNKIQLTWKTAREQNSSHFSIERSVDAIQWTVIGNLPAAGNSVIERTYSFADNTPVQSGLYRIALYDLNGRVQYTSVLRSLCGMSKIFTLWPNPAHDGIIINIVSTNESPVTIRVFDAKGSLVKTQNTRLLPGTNQLRVDIASLANGAYSVHADWENGQIKKSVLMIKR